MFKLKKELMYEHNLNTSWVHECYHLKFKWTQRDLNPRPLPISWLCKENIFQTSMQADAKAAIFQSDLWARMKLMLILGAIDKEERRL